MDLLNLHGLYYDYAIQLEEPNYFFHVEDTISGEVVPMCFNDFKRVCENEKYQEKIMNNPGFKKYLANKRIGFYEK